MFALGKQSMIAGASEMCASAYDWPTYFGKVSFRSWKSFFAVTFGGFLGSISGLLTAVSRPSSVSRPGQPPLFLLDPFPSMRCIPPSPREADARFAYICQTWTNKILSQKPKCVFTFAKTSVCNARRQITFLQRGMATAREQSFWERLGPENSFVLCDKSDFRFDIFMLASVGKLVKIACFGQFAILWQEKNCFPQARCAALFACS